MSVKLGIGVVQPERLFFFFVKLKMCLVVC